MNRPTIVSLGICAWNEENWIGDTIRSLFRQDIFHERISDFDRLEVIILANACTDGTARVARQTLEEQEATLGTSDPVRTKVVETKKGGLAWSINTITHELSDPDADYLIKMDSDIEIVERDVIHKLIRALEHDPKAEISRPRCLKHVTAKKHPTLVDRLSLLATRNKGTPLNYVPLSGALYCGRATTLRTIWEPIGARGTDVHVRDMVVTGNWRYPNDRRDERIVLVEDATALFRAYTSVADILYHRTRATIANVSRSIFHNFLREHDGPEDAGELVRRLNKEDPDWYPRLIQSRLRTDRWWVLPPGTIRWQHVRSALASPSVKRLLLLPLLIALDLIEIYAAWQANRAFKKQRELDIWRRRADG